MSDPQVLIWADGGCRGNPGVGGWGFLCVNAATRSCLERRGGLRSTTNNQMELTAALEGLRALRKPGTSVRLHTDSQYVVKAMSEWINGWKARGWRRKDGPLLNVDLLKALDEVSAQHRVQWRWVKGHAGDPGNERADALTNDAMDALQRGESPDWERRGTWNR